MEESSLLVTTTGDTPLDRLTRAIYPAALIRFLNTPLIGPVNVWSLTHIVSGALAKRLGFSGLQWFLGHTAFEWAEVRLADMTVDDINMEEFLDIVLDTAFSLVPYLLL